jgi:choline dehydrogenase-like flavoprotein
MPETWDVIVVGCGMGGATIGYELARLGRRVLFLEKGLFLHGDPGTPAPPEGAVPEIEDLLRKGRWPYPVFGTTSFGPVCFHAPLGCGTGGSTTLYSAQLERFRAADFAPRAWYPDAPDANLPEQWPVTLEQMIPYYRRAEALFGVFGTPDPLEPDPEAPLTPPPPMSERDAALFESFRALGLHPYRSHVGVDNIPNCLECDEMCPLGCKHDAGYRCLLPAMRDHKAMLLARCEAMYLLTEGRRVTGVAVRWQGEDLKLRAKIVVAAAGAWMTPLLLMRSRSAEWPEGLANSSGQLGRNLMLHATDLVTLDPGEDHSSAGPRKALTLNDYYDDGGRKLGTFQSVGLRLTDTVVEALLVSAVDRDPARWKGRRPGFAERAARLAARRFRSATLMATIMEDLPYARNRVLNDSRSVNSMRFEYDYTEELYRRSRLFQQRLIETLSPKMRVNVMPFGRNNLNYGHVCGTCRFGDDPRTSVLDASNRVHEMDNLYVVDASFFPSSGGTNPSLTVAANALRVGGIINQRL